MKITIKDISRELNLSKTTVSFVLSGNGTAMGISEKTQNRVLQYAKEMGYQPNLLARSLYSGRTNTIGVIVPSIGDAFYAELVRECEIEAKKNGYIITICSSERDFKQEVKMIRTLKTKQVDGLIIAPTEYCEQELNGLLKENFPFVLVDRFCPSIKTNYVVIDDSGTTQVLMNKLINEGRKRIALITPDTNISVTTLRNEAYENALQKAGIPFDENLVCKVKRDIYEKDIILVLENLLKNNPDVDGFYFTTHYLALETVLYFLRNNINMNKYGMACIHRNPIFKTLAPSMYVAAIPLDKMGSEAVRILLNEIDSKEIIEKKIGYVISLSKTLSV